MNFKIHPLLIICSVASIAPAAHSQSPCLDGLATAPSTQYFDEAFDRNSQGRSFSCDIFVTASQAVRALEDFRFGFLYDSKPHIERSVGFPLQVNVRNEGQEVRSMSLKNIAEWEAFDKEAFSQNERAMIACATLGNVRIYKGDGGFSIGLGRVWFVPSEEDGVKVRVSNVAPLSTELLLRACTSEFAGPG